MDYQVAFSIFSMKEAVYIMDPNQNKPRRREKNETGQSAGVHRRGDGLGTGSVGSHGGYHGRTESGSSGGSSAGTRAAIGGGGGILILILGFLLLKGGGGGLLSSLFGGGSSGGFSGGITQMLGGGGDLPYSASDSASEAQTPNYSASVTQQADTTVASGSREKRTVIKGGGQDTVTMMIYMCGTDLESRSGMASSDLQEIAKASYGDNINVIVYTGGCKGWKINGISSSTNQIYRVRNGQLEPLEQNVGNKVMTDPNTLSEFIRYCASNFPANRNELIFWDHGGGSVTGYGYDEKAASKGSMDLAGISKALKDGGVTFDFVGFDACLMATAETALMLNNYADYMIASEETEPGIGWYYTNWLTKFGQNTSMATIDIGKNIIDDFVGACDQKCRGQKTTLSITDLAEFANTVPSKLSAFSGSISTLLTNKEYDKVSDARCSAREFATSSKIDQIDLCDFALRVGNSEGKELTEAIQKAVKYNLTSSNMTNAHGISIFFPYRSVKYVDPACRTYSQINMDSAYSKCIQQFASLETSGQISAGGSATGSPLGSLFGSLSGGGSGGSSDLIGSLLSGFLGGGGKSIAGLDSSNIGFMQETPLSQQDTADYLAQNYFDPSSLVWVKDGKDYKMTLSESDWGKLHTVDKNLFFDDGTGYIDMGIDAVYDIDDNNNLVADTSRSWLAVNGQPVAYYHTDTIEGGKNADGKELWSINGYIPALLNGERVRLITVFDQDNKKGYIAGAQTDYRNGETDTVAKELTEINDGDKIDFVCDYYDYNQNYQDSYMLGEQLTVDGELKLSDVQLKEGKLKITYLFTDMFNQEYWSSAIDIE